MMNGNPLKTNRTKKMKTQLNNFVLCLILCFCSCLSVAQNNYKFEVENPIRYEFDSMIYEGLTFEFYGERKYLSKNIFYEMGTQRTLDTFKVSKKRWLIKENGIWKEFFNEKKFKKIKPLKWKDLYLFPFKKIKIKDKLLYLYKLYPDKELPKEKDRKHTVVYFSSKEGIIKIEYEKFALIRKWQNYQLRKE